MNGHWKSIAAAALVGALVAAAPSAAAGTTARLQAACEDAVKAELKEGDARIRRVTVASAGDATSYWLTVRHKEATASKSTRYRALCTVDRDGNETTLELNPGWWQKGRSGRAPIAID